MSGLLDCFRRSAAPSGKEWIYSVHLSSKTISCHCEMVLFSQLVCEVANVTPN